MDETVTDDPEVNGAATLLGAAVQAADASKAAQAEAKQAERGAREADTDARQARADAQEADTDARQARTDAQEADTDARQARTDAQQARTDAQQASADASGAAESAEELLLEDEEGREAAQVSAEQPFGVLGKPLDRRSSVRLGFGVTVGALLAIALGRAVMIVERELLLLLVAAFLAIGLEPVVGWLVGRGLRRGWAVAVILLVSLGLIGAFIAVAVPPIVQEGTRLIQQAPDYFQQLQAKNSALGRIDARFHIVDKLRTQASTGLNINAVGGLLSVGVAAISFGFEAFLVIVLMIYFLIELPRIKPVFYRLAPRSRRARVGLLGDEILARVGGYVLGNVFTSLVAVVAFYIELRILDVPDALVLSVLVGVLDLIPLVGSTLAGVVVVLVAWAAVGLTAALITVGFLLFYRVFEDYLLGPWVLRRTVDVKPLVTIVAIILGGALLGIIGALIAVPIAAAIQLLLLEVVYPRGDAA